jgi:serine/threonine protein kinase
MSAKLDDNGVFIDKLYLVGTPGFYAPESITHQRYSVQTDIWQLGCILYMLLSGLTPFHRDKIEQITHRGYYKMSGKGWDDISDNAKELVHKLLRRKGADRLSIDEILAHPWMAEATEAALDTDYKTRIKRLALRDKMQKFFREGKLCADNALRQQNLIENVPLLKETAMSVKNHPVAPKEGAGSSQVSPHNVCGPELTKEMSEFNGKLKRLKTMVVRRMSSAAEHGSDGSTSSSHLTNPEIDYSAFVSMLQHCHLEELCTPAVFNIFDIGNTGTVDPKEFLMTMLAFRPVMDMTPDVSSASSSAAAGGENAATPAEDAEARLYFDMFDITETGFIDMDELRLAVKFLLFMGADEPQDMPNVEEMFNTIDLAKNGRIDFDEFKIFYKQLLSSQNSLAVRL